MPRVTFVLALHGGLVWGGLENQAVKTREALAARGWEVAMLGSLDREVGDLVHFFGTFDGYWEVARQCMERGVPYVCSPVFLAPTTGPGLRLRAARKRITERNSYRGQRKLYQSASRLICLSRVEGANLHTYFGQGLPSMTRVPNGVDGHFGVATPDAFREAHPLDGPIVLCTGRLDARKNQLALIEAVKGMDATLALFGSLGDEAYVARCRAHAGDNVRFLGSVAPDDPVLASAYAACDVFCQPSHAEVLSLSALEAACAGAKLVLSDTWGAEEHFGDDASYVKPGDVAGIRRAIEAELKRPVVRLERRAKYVARYSWAHVAELLEKVYQVVLSKR